MTSCDYCDKDAIANYQKVWVRYPVTKDGDYGRRQNTGWWIGHLNDDPNGEDNVHVCNDHDEQWRNGEI